MRGKSANCNSFGLAEWVVVSAMKALFTFKNVGSPAGPSAEFDYALPHHACHRWCLF